MNKDKKVQPIVVDSGIKRSLDAGEEKIKRTVPKSPDDGGGECENECEAESDDESDDEDRPFLNSVPNYEKVTRKEIAKLQEQEKRKTRASSVKIVSLPASLNKTIIEKPNLLANMSSISSLASPKSICSPDKLISPKKNRQAGALRENLSTPPFLPVRLTHSKKNKPTSIRKVLFPQAGSPSCKSNGKETITRKSAALRKEADGWDALVRETENVEVIKTNNEARISALKKELALLESPSIPEDVPLEKEEIFKPAAKKRGRKPKNQTVDAQESLKRKVDKSNNLISKKRTRTTQN